MLNFKIFLSAVLALGLTGCMAPAYKDHSRFSQDNEPLNPRDVNFKKVHDYDFKAPKCVFVLPTKHEKQAVTAMIAAQSFARHLGDKIEQVIYPRLAEKIAQKQGFDLESAKDRKRFARHTKCNGYAVATLYDVGDEYAVIFSKKHIGLKLDLFSVQSDKPLWEASHTVWRADGGLPLSPLAMAGGITKAALFSQDNEIMFSMMDDAVRRMIRALPAAY